MSEARALTAAAAATLLLVAGLPVQAPFPNPVENDAGSHTDAPPFKPGLPIEPGSYVGNVTAGLDTYDRYRLDPPPATVVRVRFGPAPENPHEIQADLYSRHAEREGFAFEGWTTNISIVSGAGEPVDLVFEALATLPEVPEQRYLFNVTYERHDHVAQLRTDGDDASAWSVNVSGDGFARFEIITLPDDGIKWTPGDDDSFVHYRFLGDPSAWWDPETGCRSASGFGFGTRHVWGPQDELTGRPGPGDDPVWGHGLPVEVPDQPDASVPWERWPEHGVPPFTSSAEDPDGNLSMDVGVAYNKAWGHVGWVVWDGPADRATIEERPAEVDFWSLEDFDDGGGQGFGVGPYAQADNLTKVGHLPAGDNVTRFVHVDATTPEAWVPETGREETRMTVTAPNGSQTRLVDDHQHWTPLGDDLPRSWRASEAGPGEWRYRVGHSDGTEGDRIVVTQGSFGIEDECPGEDEMW